ncbi:MAG TPA: serine acetyltransferase [Armatimonadota bacterium]|nr:serine acetyltransferase [Armatimonadota bacterium]
MFSNYKADIDRYVCTSGGSRFYQVMMEQGLWALAVYRYSRWVRAKVHINGIRALLIWTGIFMRKIMQILTGIDLPETADIGRGLYIGHFGGIFVAHGAVIGENCNLSQGVTIGYAGRGDQWGCPNIGNRVYIAAGAKVIGRISIGDDAVIGANAVVTKDIPNKAVAVGVPAKVISYGGSTDFVFYKGESNEVDS